MSECSLINFRSSKALIESFDRICSLNGKTRTQALNEMMRQRVRTVGPKLALKLEKEKAINERLKTAVEVQSESTMADRPRQWSAAVRNRLKPFSSFDQSGA